MSDTTREAAVEIDKGLERDLQIALGLIDDTDEDAKEPTKPQNSEEAPTQEGGSQEQQESQPSSEETQTDHDPEIEVGGEKIKVSQIQEWRRGYLRQDDYTRKTQALADQRREVEQLQQRLAPLLAVEQYLASNPQAVAALQRIMQGGQLPGVPAQGKVASVPQTTQAPQGPVSRPAPTMGFGLDPVLEQRLARLEQFEYDQQLERTLQNVKAQANMDRQNVGLPPLTDDEWNQVSHRLMNEALQTRVSDLNQVYRLSSIRDEWFQAGLAKAREAARQEQTTQQRVAAGAVMGGSPRGSQAPTPAQPTPKSLDESTRAAYLELRQSGKSLFTT